MKKQVGIFLDCNKYWGGQYQYNLCLLEALNYLQSNGYEIIATYTEKSWEDDLKHYNFKKIYIPNLKLSHFFGIFLTLIDFPFNFWNRFSRFLDPIANILYKLEADIWIFSSYAFNSYQMPVRSIGVIHDLMHRYERRFPELGSWKIYHWREKAFKNLCKYNDAILVDSELGKKQTIDSYSISSKKVYVLPFIPPKYILSNKTNKDFDVKYKLPSKFIFYPAQFWEHKNHKNLILAISLLKEEIPDICLILVGSKKNAYNQIINLVESNNLKNNIQFLEYIPNDDITELYRRSRALIFPSFLGPTNIPPLEAMANNCPTAVSDVYGMKEQLGDGSCYFNPKSVEEIAQTIKNIWFDNELCAELIKKGRKRIQEYYTQDVFNNKFYFIINDILS